MPLTIGVVVVVVLVVELFEQAVAKKPNIKIYIILGVIGEGLRIGCKNNNKV